MYANSVALIYFFGKPPAPWRVQVARRLHAKPWSPNGWLVPGRHFLGPAYIIALASRDHAQALRMH